MNGLVALGLGFVLLVVVAWVDRRYLQRYEAVRSRDEEHRQLGTSPPAQELERVPEEHARTEETPAVPTRGRRRAAKAAGTVQIRAQQVAPAEELTPSGRVATLDRENIAWKDEPAPSEDSGDQLPRGAEAALASILEAIPDPRNTFALTKDPTAEVRLTPAERRAG